MDERTPAALPPPPFTGQLSDRASDVVSPSRALGLVLRSLSSAGRLNDLAPFIQPVALFVSHLERRQRITSLNAICPNHIRSFLEEARSPIAAQAISTFLQEAAAIGVGPELNGGGW